MVHVREEDPFERIGIKSGKAEPLSKIPEVTGIKVLCWGIRIQGGLGITPISPYDQHIRISLCGSGFEPSAKDRKKSVVFSSNRTTRVPSGVLFRSGYFSINSSIFRSIAVY
jgi:hypothetical protein